MSQVRIISAYIKTSRQVRSNAPALYIPDTMPETPMNEPVESQASRQTQSLLAGIQKKLVETSTRNRLINVNRQNQRGPALNIINEKSDEIFNILKNERKKMRFKAMGQEQPPEEDEEDTPDLSEPEEAFDESRYTDQYLETPLTKDALQKRLLRLEREARISEQEQGANFLFLALGFLKWTESKSSSLERWAPLLLLPVELKRERKGSLFTLRYRDDDFSENLALQKRLETDFRILLPAFPNASDWTPSDYFEEVGTTIGTRPEWDIDPDGMQLGFFSFTKQLIMRDLDLGQWGSGLNDHPLFANLLQHGFSASQPGIPPNAQLDKLLEPGEIIQVTDADASQTKVIEEVRKGGNLVVQGPPGTGKSQTITNIIASALYDGKTVLFMAEKMAALSVVHRKLKQAGLEDPCLELHSHKARKSLWAQELKRTLNSTRNRRQSTPESSREDPAHSSLAAELKRSRDELNQICAALHTPLAPDDFSPFEILTELVAFHGKPLVAQLAETRDALGNISRQQHATIIKDIRKLFEVRAHSGPAIEHPFYGVGNTALQPYDYSALQTELSTAHAQIEALMRHFPDFHSMEAFAFASRLQDAPAHITELLPITHQHADKPNIGHAIDQGCLWQDAREAAQTRFTDTALDSDAGALEGILAAGAAGGISALFTRLGGNYRASTQSLQGYCRQPLPRNPKQRLDLLRELLSAQRRRRDSLKANADTPWYSEQTNFRHVKEAWEWHNQIEELGLMQAMLCYLQSTEHLEREELTKQQQQARAALDKVLQHLDMDAATVPSERMALAELLDRLSNMEQQMERYSEWVELLHLRQRLGEEHGLQPLLDALDEGTLDADGAVDAFRYACAQGYWRRVCTRIPELKDPRYRHRHDLTAAYSELEQKYTKSVRDLIYQTYLRQVPQGSVGPMGILNSEASKSRSHKPIRGIIENTVEVLQKIKPIFLMSPSSIAKFLTPEKIGFDLLVIDEASQVRPEDALGAVARAKQIVVVGDQKQLPPTSFFDRMSDPEDQDEDEEYTAAHAGEMESILSLCEARGLPDRMLEWHYRSKDPSLIQVSNKEFYDSRLILPASPLQLDDYYGLKFTRVPGVYSRGKKRTNRIEADAVVSAIARHAREATDFSLGIVTFSSAQSTMIAEVLEHARRSDAILDTFMREGESGEEVFIKSIENVQGDERDVIMISVGYGPDTPNGALASMNFGPINQEGGERRLNVLFTRSRLRCEIFASFGPEDMDTRRISKDGPRIFKRFLEFASSGQLQEMHPTGQGFDSPFEEDVAAEVEACGFYADPQVGTSGFRIDIGVRPKDKPGQYILAVECDGATYHSSAWARERDHLRQQVLEGMGWKFHRIWSTDWFQNRKGERDRLEEALRHADRETRDGVRVTGANADCHELPETEEEPSAPPATEDQELLSRSGFQAPVYQRIMLRDLPILEDLYAYGDSELYPAMRQIIEQEGPVHPDEIMRRILEGCGRVSLTQKARHFLLEFLQAFAKQDVDIQVDADGFYGTATQHAQPPIRDRSEQPSATRDCEMLPPSEIRATANRLYEENGRMNIDETVREVARALGYRSTSEALAETIRDALQHHDGPTPQTA